ncbi:MAG: hypothetical protein LBE16_02910, partial [Clostridiales Family XIII bacterium]|nr:hypothetical protein [Clostridiales Family XIII bacterium]
MKPKKILALHLALVLATFLYTGAAFAAEDITAVAGPFAERYYVDEEGSVPPSDEEEQNTTPGSGEQSGGAVETVDLTKDGRYYVNVVLWKALENAVSMGNIAFRDFSPNALLITEGGRYRLQVGTQPVLASGYTTAITDVEGTSVNIVLRGSFTTNTKYDGTAHDLNYVRVFELALSNTTTASVPIRFKVPYTPMDAVGAATDGWLDARLHIEWSGATKAPANAELNPPTTVATGSSSLDAVASAPSASLADRTTGIKQTAQAGIVPTDAELKVTAITSGADFTKTEAAIKETRQAEETPKFKLYDISLIQSKVEIQPNGTITLSVPIPADYDKAKVLFYRINDDGTATLIKGKVSGS